MKQWMWLMAVIVLCAVVLSGCGDKEAAAATITEAPGVNNQAVAIGGGAAAAGAPAQQRGEPFQSAYLTNTYTNALPVTMQLALGTLTLESSENAVTGEQAKKLLLFYQALQSDAIQGAEERNAIFKQIEATMTPIQMATIADQRLTGADLTAWATANNIALPPDALRQGGGPGRQGQGQGRFADLSEEERTKLREELQTLTPEERRTRLRELGIEVPEGDGQGQGGQGQGGQGRQRQGGQGQGGQGQGGQGGRFNLLLEPVINFLSARSAQ